MRVLTIDDLPLTPADPASPIPLYHQVEISLRGLIAGGVIAPGDVLPPETMLCKAYAVGRHTMRQALGRLAADDLIERKAGRGTLVKPARRRVDLDRSFTRQMHDLGMTASSRVIEARMIVVGDDAPAPLTEHAGSPAFYLERLRYGDGEPIGLQAATVITTRCPGLDAYDFARESLYAVLARAYHLHIARIEHTVGASNADEMQAEWLGVAPGDALVVVKTTAYLADDALLEYNVSHYRADKYEYNITHTFTKGTA